MAGDSLQVITLEDIAVIDFKTEHDHIFKNSDLVRNTSKIGLASTLEDAIKNTTPIYFKNYSYGGISTIDFRGTGSERTQVYWNGVPLNSPSLGSFDFSLLPSFFISDAKLRYGGASLVDGGGGIGASVQLNQNNNFSKNSLKVIGNASSFSNYSSGFIAQFVTGKMKSDTRVLYHQGKNDFEFSNEAKKGNPTETRLNNELWRLGFQQAFLFNINSSNSLSLNALYSKVDRNIPPSISTTSGGDWQGDDLFLGQLVYDKLFNNGYFLKLRSSYQNQQNHYKSEYVDALNTVDAWNNKIDFGGILGKSLKFNTSFRYDLNYVDTDGAGKIQENVFSSLLAIDYTILKSLFFSGGLRYELRSSKDSPIMPFVGLSWFLPKNAGQLKANLSRVFRFPTINELYWNPGGNSDLEAEKGWNYELSYAYKKSWSIFDLQFLINTYYSLVSNWILWYPSAENSLIWQAQNVWEVEAKGIEINTRFSFEFNNYWKLNTQVLYTYNSSQVLEDISNEQTLVGKQLILVPKHQLMIPLSLKHKNYLLGIDYQYTSERFTDRYNTNALDAYHLLDLLLAYEFIKPSLELSFRLRNILDQQYETFPGQPLPGINFNIQIAWQLY